MVGWYPYWRRCRAATKPSPPRERQVSLCPQVRELRRRYHKLTIVAGATGYENPATSAGRVNTVDSTGGKNNVSLDQKSPTEPRRGTRNRPSCKHVGCVAAIPAWETERPASSMSWSMEKAQVDISSLSRAAAALPESVWGGSVSSALHPRTNVARGALP